MKITTAGSIVRKPIVHVIITKTSGDHIGDGCGGVTREEDEGLISHEVPW